MDMLREKAFVWRRRLDKTMLKEKDRSEDTEEGGLWLSLSGLG